MSTLEEARQILEANGLPGRILPLANQVSFDGRAFRAELGVKQHDIKVGDYPVRYGSVLTGTLLPGRIEQLRGVKAKKVVWFPVTAIQVDGEELIFEVGPVKVRAPRSAFG